jgi:hypothetical protein
MVTLYKCQLYVCRTSTCLSQRSQSDRRDTEEMQRCAGKAKVADSESDNPLTKDLSDMHACRADEFIDLQRFSSTLLMIAVVAKA